MKLRFARLVKNTIDYLGWSLLMALLATIIGLIIAVVYLLYTVFGYLFKLVVGVALLVWGMALLYEWASNTINSTPK